MASDGCNDGARGHGVAVLLQILNHGHLRELEVGQDRTPFHFEARHRRCCALEAREHAIWVDAPLPRFVFAAALAQHGGRVDTDRVVLLEVAQCLALERDEGVSYPLPRLGFGPGAHDGIRGLLSPTCGDQRFDRQCVSCQQAVDGLPLGAQVEGADFEVAVEEEGIRS